MARAADGPPAGIFEDDVADGDDVAEDEAEDAYFGAPLNAVVYSPATDEALGALVPETKVIQVDSMRGTPYVLYQGRDGTFGIGYRVDLSDRPGFVERRSPQLTRSLAAAKGSQTPRPDGEETWILIARAVGRAQRSVHPRSTAEALLREELSDLGRQSAVAAKFGRDAFNESGALKLSLAEVMAQVQRGAAGDAAPSGPLGLERDLRVLPIIKNGLGVRHRSFETAVQAMTEAAWADWPLAGPRTTLFVLSYIAEHYQTPEQRHARFISEGKLSYSDHGVSAHQVMMKLLYLGAVVDQLDLPQLSWCELACRHGQMVELKYKGNGALAMWVDIAAEDV